MCVHLYSNVFLFFVFFILQPLLVILMCYVSHCQTLSWFCWAEAGTQAGKPICAVFSLTACGCTVSEGKTKGESHCNGERKEKKKIMKILAPNPINKEKEKKLVFLFIFEPVSGGRALNNLWRELCWLIRKCECVQALIHMCAQTDVCFSNCMHYKWVWIRMDAWSA